MKLFKLLTTVEIIDKMNRTGDEIDSTVYDEEGDEDDDDFEDLEDGEDEEFGDEEGEDDDVEDSEGSDDEKPKASAKKARKN